MEWSSIAFYLVSFLILLTGGLVAFRPKPIESALWLVVNFFLTSALYVFLGSYFVATIQILVYTGAIVVLFTFVILLLNLDPKELGLNEALPWTSFVLVIGAISAVLLCFHVATPELLATMPDLEDAHLFGSVENFSKEFLTKYYWGFEIAGFLLLLAIVGVGLLASRETNKARLAPPKSTNTDKEAA
jgi:NADH-quinone oxidoreductase subunit J